MKMKNKTMNEDLDAAASAEFIPWGMLKGANILVTGATGLVGFTLTNVLLCANRMRNLDLTVLALVRDLNRAKSRFSEFLNCPEKKPACGDTALKFIVGTVEELPEISDPIDYIVHGASPTASKTFIEKPVDVLRTAILGTDNILRLAREKASRGVVYLSSMEMYGFPEKGHRVTEDEAGALSPLNVRNSYPLGKQACEALCAAYAEQYKVPAKIARLTQTIGPGVNYDDTRIFAYFGRCVIEKTDIILKTRGETERSYLYTTDAATAILTILLKGKSGAAYNCADESTYCSIANMAEKVAALAGISVLYEGGMDSLGSAPTENSKDKPGESAAAAGYPDTLYMDLDCSKLRDLGWIPYGGAWPNV